MGTLAATSHATTYIDKFENTYFYPEIKNDCIFYARLIDDILIIYISGEAKLNNFPTNLDMMPDSFKFHREKSADSIAFLETSYILTWIDNYKQYDTKHTNTHNYLHYRSSHSKHLKDRISYSQAIRQRRICTDEMDLKMQSDKRKQRFSTRGYTQMLNEN